MLGTTFMLACILPCAGWSAPAPGDRAPAAVETLLKKYCDRHGLERKQLESWDSALAAEGRVFRYKLAAVEAKGKEEGLSERFAFVFVDPGPGNVYDVKRSAGGEKTVEQRIWAILRLMGTKIGNDRHAEAVMADLFRLDGLLTRTRQEPFSVRLVQVQTGKSWIEPAKTYHADHSIGVRLVMTVDEDGYVLSFRVWNIR